jgi:hypothetical protein
MQESRNLYSVTVEMPSGVKTIGVSAVSTWHAIEIVYTLHSQDQEDRAKYKVKKFK